MYACMLHFLVQLQVSIDTTFCLIHYSHNGKQGSLASEASVNHAAVLITESPADT